jgi:hypothetical protein
MSILIKSVGFVRIIKANKTLPQPFQVFNEESTLTVYASELGQCVGLWQQRVTKLLIQ